MVASIAVSVYMGIGLIIAFYSFKTMDKAIDDKENGKTLDDDTERQLEVLKRLNQMGHQHNVTLDFVIYALFWLPFILYILLTGKYKGNWEDL